MKYYFKCPNCKSNDQFTLPTEASSNLGCLLFIFGGFIPYLLYADSTNRRVQCTQCGYIFRRPPLPRTPLSILSSWVGGIVFISSLFTFLMISVPEITSLVPQHLFISNLEKIISDNPKAIVIGVIPMMLLLILVAVIASGVSDHRANKELKQKFETSPKTFSESKK